MFEDRIYSRFSNEAAERVAEEVVVAGSYTLVRLDDGALGIARTPRRRSPYQPQARPRQQRSPRGRYSQQSGLNLLSLVLTEDPIDRAVGFATLNALAGTLGAAGETGNLVDTLPVTPGQRLLSFGHFKPIQARFEARGVAVSHVELGPGEHPDRVPDKDVDEALGLADWVLASGETLVNGSFSELMGRLPEGKKLILLGPSTPLDPGLFCHLPVRALSGIRVTDPERFAWIIREGGATLDIGEAVEKRTIWLD